MILAATGHRPHKLRLGGAPGSRFKLIDFAQEWLSHLEPDEVISGMALGWDQAVAWAALRLEIPLIAALPFKGQERSWSSWQKQQYEEILSKAARIHVVCPWSFTIAYQRRDEWMVNRADEILALWDGSPSGTGYTIKYAEEWKPLAQIHNVWPEWEKRLGNA